MAAPKLEILSPPQRRLWSELEETPQEFVFYGGTALALRLGHRTSEDFDFFPNRPFLPDALRKTIGYLQDAEMRQFEENTLTAMVDRDGPVKRVLFGKTEAESCSKPRCYARERDKSSIPYRCRCDESGYHPAAGPDQRLREIRTVLRYFSEKGFDAVLNDPYAGIFDRRSWVYWNGRYHHEPVPELPKRKIQ